MSYNVCRRCMCVIDVCFNVWLNNCVISALLDGFTAPQHDFWFRKLINSQCPIKHFSITILQLIFFDRKSLWTLRFFDFSLYWQIIRSMKANWSPWETMRGHIWRYLKSLCYQLLQLKFLTFSDFCCCFSILWNILGVRKILMTSNWVWNRSSFRLQMIADNFEHLACKLFEIYLIFDLMALIKMDFWKMIRFLKMCHFLWPACSLVKLSYN